MAFSQTDLDTINAAIASGTRSVTFSDGRRHEYQTLDEMIRARALIQADLANTTPADQRLIPRYQRAIFAD